MPRSAGLGEDLRGGGLIRSAGGRKQLMRCGKGERELGDEWILGAGPFVEGILKGQTRPVTRTSGNLKDILVEVCKQWEILRERVLSRSRLRREAWRTECSFSVPMSKRENGCLLWSVFAVLPTPL